MKIVKYRYILLALAAAALLLRKDVLSYAVWWLSILALGWIFLPVTSLLFKNFQNKGYIFAKSIGLAVSGYLLWFLASFQILPFTAWAAYLVLLLCLAGNVLLSRKYALYGYSEALRDDGSFGRIVKQEALFMVLLALWSYFRARKPEILGLEKFMDFGFVNAILRSEYFPPPDIWFAGEPINYYYLGQYFSAFLTRISLLDSAVTYNLMMATLFALAFAQSFSIGEMLFEIYERNAPKFTPIRRSKVLCGLLCGALVCFSGNLHTVVYAWFFKGESSYWFSDATRYIGYNPPVEHDRTIHEFPFYSFVVSDLHAHVINMIFVLTVVALAIAVGMGVLSKRKQQWGDPAFWAVIFLIGLFPATNFWDFPIYITVACAIYFYANLRVYEFSLRSCLTTLRQLILTGCAAFAVVFPFHMSFVSMSTKVALVQTQSKFYQLLVLYGYQAAFFVMLLVIVYQAYWNLKPASAQSGAGRKSSKKSAKSARNKNQAQSQTAADTHPLRIPVSEKQQPRVLFDFLERINPADALALILFICALGLILIPEVVYVVDIYPSHPRANTMFKLCYQAFIMLALCVGYTSFRLIHLPKPDRSKFLLPAGVLLFCAFVYPHYALEDWYWPHKFQGLDGTRYMLTHQEKIGQTDDAVFELALEDDYDLIQYIKRNVKGTPVITEANGSSNTSYGRISANTGLPDIFNWYVHQQLWRNSDIPAYNERIADLETVYTEPDQAAVMDVLRKYQAQYIVVGKLERAKYADRLNESLLTGLGEIVFQKNQTVLIEVNQT